MSIWNEILYKCAGIYSVYMHTIDMIISLGKVIPSVSTTSHCHKSGFSLIYSQGWIGVITTVFQRDFNTQGEGKPLNRKLLNILCLSFSK